MSQVLAEIETLVTPLLSQEHVELVDLTYQKEHGRWILRCLLDKAGGFSLQDCEEWSRKLGDALDQSSLLNQQYMLEISSPGLDRPLKRLKDFQRFVGERVRVRLYSPIDQQRNFQGVLMEADEQTIRLKVEGDRVVALPRREVFKANLDPIIEF